MQAIQTHRAREIERERPGGRTLSHSFNFFLLLLDCWCVGLYSCVFFLHYLMWFVFFASSTLIPSLNFNSSSNENLKNLLFTFVRCALCVCVCVSGVDSVYCVCQGSFVANVHCYAFVSWSSSSSSIHFSVSVLFRFFFHLFLRISHFHERPCNVNEHKRTNKKMCN